MAENGVSIKGYADEGSYQLDDGTKAMSLEHAKDSYEYNLRHAEEHLEKAKEICHKLIKMGKAGEVETPKSLLDLFKYFEETKDLESDGKSENAATMPLDKLKKKVQNKSEEY